MSHIKMKEIFELLNEVDFSSAELGSIEQSGEDCDSKARGCNVIISELESVGLEFRKKSDVRIQSVENVNLNLDPVNAEKRIEIFCGGRGGG